MNKLKLLMSQMAYNQTVERIQIIYDYIEALEWRESVLCRLDIELESLKRLLYNSNVRIDKYNEFMELRKRNAKIDQNKKAI